MRRPSSRRSGACSRRLPPVTCCSGPRRCGSSRQRSTSSRTSRATAIACCGSIRGRSRSRATSTRRSSDASRSSTRSTRHWRRSERSRSAASRRPARRAGDRQDAARERVPRAGGEQGAHACRAGAGPTATARGCCRSATSSSSSSRSTPSLADEPDAARILGPLRERALAEPSDAFWAFRRLLEVSRGDAPLVVLLEDLHWAAPDLLDLVEYLLGWATGPLLLLCVARPELLESRPEWRDDAIVLGPISGDEARTLVELLPERAGLPRERRRRGGRDGRGQPAVPRAARRLRRRGRARSAAADARGV